MCDWGDQYGSLDHRSHNDYYDCAVCDQQLLLSTSLFCMRRQHANQFQHITKKLWPESQ